MDWKKVLALLWMLLVQISFSIQGGEAAKNVLFISKRWTSKHNFPTGIGTTRCTPTATPLVVISDGEGSKFGLR